ncbi:protein Flattop [Chanodichthys erythropterus]|uniref:protein Flattop n=1 Tax=Chanodichthys erythropterus TaxID=933992 RepID=UPI00351F4C06
MSTSYSANQYESAFRSQKLQNWTIPKHFKERPSAAEGHTSFIATDRGHLLPGVRKKSGSAWPGFQGTWDLPRQIPPASINPTARSQEGQDRLRTWGRIKFATNQAHEPINRSTHNVLENINVEQTAEESEIPVSDPDQNERPKSQNSQDKSRPTSQQAQSNPVNLHENQVQSRPGSHHSQQAPSRPATQESQAELRPPTQNSRPTSQQK